MNEQLQIWTLSKFWRRMLSRSSLIPKKGEGRRYRRDNLNDLHGSFCNTTRKKTLARWVSRALPTTKEFKWKSTLSSVPCVIDSQVGTQEQQRRREQWQQQRQQQEQHKSNRYGNNDNNKNINEYNNSKNNNDDDDTNSKNWFFSRLVCIGRNSIPRQPKLIRKNHSD